jgi:hypothetical protein
MAPLPPSLQKLVDPQRLRIRGNLRAKRRINKHLAMPGSLLLVVNKMKAMTTSGQRRAPRSHQALLDRALDLLEEKHLPQMRCLPQGGTHSYQIRHQSHLLRLLRRVNLMDPLNRVKRYINITATR